MSTVKPVSRASLFAKLSPNACRSSTCTKKTGGAGQFAKVVGHLEPTGGSGINLDSNEFVDKTVGGSVPPQYVPAVNKGFLDAAAKGPLTGHPICGVRMVLEDGASHHVDSSEMAFRTCTSIATKNAMKAGACAILEPIMKVSVQAPTEFQGTLIANLTRRKGLITATESHDDYVDIEAEVGLSKMFGYSTDLRSSTQGKGEFTMEYSRHAAIGRDEQDAMVGEYEKLRAAGKIRD